MAALIHLSLLVQLFLTNLMTISSLPVTSKPIENTPENLAWEAWIMVPPTHDKTRKITPKSIFILPNKTNGGSPNSGFSSQLQCPPGHRIDNFKCIPTISIDRNQILITQLTNLLHATDKYNSDGNNNSGTNINYDYDYDYGDSYDPDPDLPTSFAQAPSDYNGEPFKVNLSLGKLPAIRDDSKETGNFGVITDVDGSDEYDNSDDALKVQPFLGEISSSTSTASTTTTSTASNNESSTTTVTQSTTTISQNGNDTTKPSIISYTELSGVVKDSTLSPSSISTVHSTVPIISSTESEMVTSKNNNTDPEDLDYSLDEQSTTRTTTIDDSDIELITEEDEKDITTNFKDELIKDSLVLDANESMHDENHTETADDSTESIDQMTTMVDGQDQTDAESFSSSSTTTTHKQLIPATNSISGNVDRTPPHIQQPNNNNNHQIVDHQQNTEQPVENNRHIYHHHLSSNKPPERVETTTSDIQEQLRIINQIVEDNKKRSQQGSRINFSPDTLTRDRDLHVRPLHHTSGISFSSEHEPLDNNRRDYIRFPEPSRIPPRHLYNEHQYYPELHQQPLPTIATDQQRNTKPLWWLPTTGFEVDRNGQRPLLLRFWSRLPDNQEPSTRSRSSSSSSTTSGYRENSRSPTENLYKEISAQEVYKVLGAKNWKHNNR